MVKIDTKKFIEHLEKYWADKPCPLCKGEEWVVSDEVFEIREFNKGSLIIGGETKIFPLLPVTCKKCGHVVFFNALQTKLMDDKTKNAEAKD